MWNGIERIVLTVRFSINVHSVTPQEALRPLSRKICDLEQVCQALYTHSLHQETVESILQFGTMKSHEIVCLYRTGELHRKRGKGEYSGNIDERIVKVFSLRVS